MSRNTPPAVFDQWRRPHQDWLLAELDQAGLHGFYEAQDIGDLLQGRPRSDLGAVVARYQQNLRELTYPQFLARLIDAKKHPRSAGDRLWETAEVRARLRYPPERSRT